MSVVRHIHRDDFRDDAVRGVMEGGGEVLQTLEDPDDLIPPGDYTCVKDFWHARGVDTYEVEVAGRDRILFHWGNTLEDTEGCILLGLGRGVINGLNAVTHSHAAFEQFMDELEDVEVFTLRITEG